MLERRVTDLWYRESAGISLLAPLSWLYGTAVRAQSLATARMWYVPVAAHLNDADTEAILSLISERIAPC